MRDIVAARIQKQIERAYGPGALKYEPLMIPRLETVMSDTPKEGCTCARTIPRNEYRHLGNVTRSVHSAEGTFARAIPPAHEYFVLLQTETGARAWSAMTREEAERMAHALNAETGMWWRVVHTRD